MARIYSAVQTQANMLSYLDVFKIMSYGCLVVLVLVLALRHVDRGEKPAMGH
jgi:hypothetical protein